MTFEILFVKTQSHDDLLITECKIAQDKEEARELILAHYPDARIYRIRAL